jgi:hypothetical protein
MFREHKAIVDLEAGSAAVTNSQQTPTLSQRPQTLHERGANVIYNDIHAAFVRGNKNGL